MTSDKLVPIVEDTGEIVPLAGELTIETLVTLSHAKMRGDALQAVLDQRMADLTASDPECARTREALSEARAVEASILDSLEQSIAPEVRRRVGEAISLDIGKVRVTWGKAPKRTVQRVKPAFLLEHKPELAKELGIEEVETDLPKPRVTYRGGDGK